MTKLKYCGYKEVTAQTRAMTLGELKLYILRAYMEKGIREVQLIDITCGDSIKFNTVEDVLKNEWCDNCKIEIINLPHGYGYGDDVKTIIIFQEAECDEDKVII